MADEVRGYEKCFDMPFGGTSEEPHIGKGFVRFALGILNVVLKLPFRFTVDNRESIAHLVNKTGIVVVANHTSYLDVLFLYMAVRPAGWPRLMAKSSLFDGKPRFAGWVLAHAGVFPIHRDSADRTAIKRAARMLKNNEIVGIMPEGTRRGKSDILPTVHGGAALIARMGHAPIIPMTVRNAEKIKEKGKFLRFPKVSAEFGDPILVEDFDFLPKENRLEGCIWYALRECFAMFQNTTPEKVDMAALFPEGHDYTEEFANHDMPKRTSAELAQLLERKAEGE